MLGLNIQKVYVMSMDIDNDSVDIKNRFNRLFKSGYYPELEIIPCVDGNDIDVDFDWDVYDWEIKDHHNQWYNRPITIGELGCTLSHINIWKKALKDITDENAQILILEDDFNPIINLVELGIPDDVEWDLLYLGREDILDYYNEEVLTPFIRKPLFSYGAHAYVLSIGGVKKLLNYNMEKSIICIDEFLPATFTKHPRNDIEEIYDNKNIKALATNVTWVDELDQYKSTTRHGESPLWKKQ
tara:strand:+ start:2468 stop:3193 length:726 start_codon:yes stop_codon:yes gene_type:complete